MKRVNKETKAMKQAIKDMIASDVKHQVLTLDEVFRTSHQTQTDVMYNI